MHEAQRRLRQAQEESARRCSGDRRPPLNTTLAVVATDADLTRAQAQKLAGTAHDGLARAVRPVHLLNDGDTVFALATGQHAVDGAALNELLAAGADVLTRSIVRGVLAAEGVDGSGGVLPSYRDLYVGAERRHVRPRRSPCRPPPPAELVLPTAATVPGRL